MAKNDIILIDNIIQDRILGLLPSANEGEVFEYLSSEQVLKDFDLTKDEILSGIVDGKDDGGIDSFFIFVNGSLLTDLDSFPMPKKSCEITVVLITSKHHKTFEQVVLNNQYATISELFDLSKSDIELQGAYNPDIMEKRRLFVGAYKKTASALDKLSFELFYVSRGDASIVGENIVARAEQIKSKFGELFSNCQTEYSFYGSSELLALYRKKPEFELELSHSGIISYNRGCFIVLCNLGDYYSFISDESNKLKRYLFDSNVRDFMGYNNVNEDIYNSLMHGGDMDFWWLNNGITILASHAVNVGNTLKLQDVQIVNGLQTSKAIFDFFSANSSMEDKRSVMIKVVSLTDSEMRDRIIRSTNNQTPIYSKSLFATDKIQRDIEDIMKHHGLYYERRVNYYKNQDVDQSLIFDIMGLGAAYLAFIIRVPEKAASFKQKFLKDSKKYDLLFNHGSPLLIWPFIATLLKRVDKGLNEEILKVTNNVGMLRKCRYLVGIIVLGRVMGTFNYSVEDLLSLKDDAISDSLIMSSAQFVVDRYSKDHMRSRFYVMSILRAASIEFEIQDVEGIIKRKNVFVTDDGHIKRRKVRQVKTEIPEETISAVKSALPPQPWPAGVLGRTAECLGISRDVVHDAIAILVARHEVYEQYNGVLYDKDGAVVFTKSK